jgi:hypothetical protein
MDGACNTHRAEEECMQGLDKKTWKNYATKENRLRWEDNIKMDLKEIGWGVWTGLISLRMWHVEFSVKTVMNLYVV